MKNFWKRLGEWGTALRTKIGVDIFTAARLKITFLYLLMGVIIMAVAGFVIYTHIFEIIQAVLQVITGLVQSQTPVNQNASAQIIAQAIETEVQKMNIAVASWTVGIIVVSAYILAGITMRPIRRAMERQKRFVANVAHELRTPLSVMKTESEIALLENEASLDDELGGVLKRNLLEINRMSRTIQFLLDFSMLGGRAQGAGSSRVDFSAVVGRTVKLMEREAAEKRIMLIFNSDGRVVVRGSEVALEEMTLNLLKNALRYTPPGGSVSFTVVKGGYGGATMVIKDSGIGIPSEDIPYIFEPFFRAKNVKSVTERKDHGGSVGLGLAIVKEIADFHRATISVKSVLNEGTTITVHFPFIS